MTQPARPLRSWRWLLPCAILPLLAVAVLGPLGGKDSIRMITGTKPLSEIEIVVGFSYLLSYLTLTLLSPVFVLAAVMISIRDLRVRRSSTRA